MGKRKITADDLVAAAEEVRALDAERSAAMERRNAAIVRAVGEGMTMYRVAQVTGLDERGVGRIREKAEAAKG